jgi:predicted enzyme related to lactoylglutathione lyase
MTDSFIVRDGYPPGVPCWVDTAQPDVEAGAQFYGGLFGWDLQDQMPPGEGGRYFAARLQGYDVAAIGSQPDPSVTTAVWQTYIAVDNADASAAKVEAGGGRVLVPPFDVVSAGRMAVCADPGGAVFNVWQAGDHRGAQLVNYPNTWNWSDLNTGDPEGAKAFYGTVFGWEARTMGASEEGGGFTVWCLPGYGDYLAEIEPEIRERQATAGAPEGFADAIAGFAVSEDVPPHWGVTFTVEDPDASAKRVTELGGQVLMEPFDAGPVRIAVLADPQGATFSVLRYSPG